MDAITDAGKLHDGELEKINKFTRRPLKEDEIYAFTVTLCDNDIDRDGEAFSVTALEQMAKLFIGKTGICDHTARAQNQKARIFDTKVITDISQKTADGRDYCYLSARAYMPRVKSNADLISEIDAGIKKEVSVGCAVSEKCCSICKQDIKEGCNHVKGRLYKSPEGRVPCFTVLKEVTDAYEWSFVAVPAQRRAGVTKSYKTEEEKCLDINGILCNLKSEGEITISCDEAEILKNYIAKLSQLSELGKTYLAEKRAAVIKDFKFPAGISAETKSAIVESLSAKQLSEVYTALADEEKKNAEVQLCPMNKKAELQNGGFMIK